VKADIDRTDKRRRDAESARRYRQRRTRKQAIYRITGHKLRTYDMLVRKGFLHGGIEHDHAAVEAALTLFIDDEGRK
jgi:hypothetical protein